MPPVLSGRDLSNFCWIDPVGGASFFPKPVFGSGEEAPDVGAVPQYRQNCRCGKKGQGKRASGSEIDGKNMAGDGGRTASQGEPWHFWIADLHDDRWNRSLQEIKTEANPSRTFTHTPGNVGGPDVSGSGLANVDPMQFADQKTEGNCSHQI